MFAIADGVGHPVRVDFQTEVSPRRRRTGAIVAVAVTTFVVVALAIAAVVVFTGRGDRGRPAAGPAATSTAAEPPATTASEPAPAATPSTPAPPAAGTPTAPPPAQPPAPPTPTTCTDCVMQDGVTYTVGATGPHAARAGQYHTDGPTTANGTCEWTLVFGTDRREKSFFGPTDILVRAGASFTSRGCRTWHLTVPA
jgi:hypothetical protein